MPNADRDTSASPGGLSRRGLGALGAAALLGAGPARAQTAAPMRAAAIFSTPIEEPWVTQIHQALLKAKAEHGIDYAWSEHVAAADYGRVLREYAEKGVPLIFGDAFAAETIARRTARQYPKTAFVFGSGQGPADAATEPLGGGEPPPCRSGGQHRGDVLEADDARDLLDQVEGVL